jgi:hypothetical protein
VRVIERLDEGFAGTSGERERLHRLRPKGAGTGRHVVLQGGGTVSARR